MIMSVEKNFQARISKEHCSVKQKVVKCSALSLCMDEPLRRSSEPSTAVLTGYTPVQNKSLKFGRKKLFGEGDATFMPLSGVQILYKDVFTMVFIQIVQVNLS